MTDLLLEILKYYGLKEVSISDQHNPDIIKMFKDLGYDIKDDETAWCSATINYFAKKLGYEYTGKLDARSWLQMSIKVLKPQMGDLVIFWRNDPKSWEGHVGIYISEDKNYIYVLGGNQNNMINITPYPKTKVLGFRQLKKIK